MKPEAEVEILLSEWLLTKSSYIKKIYFNRKNELTNLIFKVKGEMKIPDLVLEIDKGYGKEYYAIEVKDNSQSINILKGSKIIEYFKRYALKKTKYFIEKEEIKIKGFLLATQSSINGYLYKEENIKDNFEADKESSRYLVSKKYKIIPRKEGERTFDFIRQLWNEYGKTRNDFNIKSFLGILIANSEDNFKPWIMVTDYNKKNKRWSQRWWKI